MSKNFVRFGNLFDYENKSKIKAGDGLQSGKYPFYTSSNELSKYLDEYSFDKTSLIFGTGGNASIHYTDMPFSVSTDCLVSFAIDTKIVYPKFVYYYLSGNINLLEEGFKGAGLKHISKGFINDIQIPLPPITTQKRIAEILDAADALRRKDQALLKKYDELAQAIFIDMFGDPVINEKGWEVKKLGEVCNKITDGEHLNPAIISVGKPLIMAKDIRFDGVDFSDYKCVSEIDFIKFTKKCKPEFGDLILVSRGATIGRCCVVNTTREFCLMGSTILIKAGINLSTSYLHELFKIENYKNTLVNVSSASAQQAIYISNVKELDIPIPPIDLQKNFSVKIQAIKSQFDIQNCIIESSSNLFQTLIQKAFKGELVN